LELLYNGRIVGLTHFIRGSIVDVSDDDKGGGVGGDDI